MFFCPSHRLFSSCVFLLQVSKANNTPLCRSVHSNPSFISGSFSDYSGAPLEGFAQSQQSKPYLMCTATDAASAVMDFSTQKVDDGVVDSPPERRAGIPTVASPSPLKRTCSFVGPVSDCTPQRQLYVDDAVDLNQLTEPKLISIDVVPPSIGTIQPSSTPRKQRRLHSSRSHGTLGVGYSHISSIGLPTQSLGLKPRPWRTTSSQLRRNPLFLNGGDGSTADGCHCHQSSAMVNDSERDAYFEPYSRRREIMIGYEKVKAQNALLLRTRGSDSTMPLSDRKTAQ